MSTMSPEDAERIISEIAAALPLLKRVGQLLNRTTEAKLQARAELDREHAARHLWEAVFVQTLRECTGRALELRRAELIAAGADSVEAAEVAVELAASTADHALTAWHRRGWQSGALAPEVDAAAGVDGGPTWPPSSTTEH